MSDVVFTVRDAPVPDDAPRRFDDKGDIRHMSNLLGAVAEMSGSEPDRMNIFVHEGIPESKARARVVGRNTYTPARTRAAEEALAWRYKEAVVESFEGNLAVAAVFYRPNHQRIDTDNLLKLVLDAGTKAGAWKDDSQVTTQLGILELDAERPRTVIGIVPISSTMTRGPVLLECPRCGSTFQVPQGGWRARKYCSVKCAQPPAVARCARCGVEFHRRGAGKRYCSRECAGTAPRVRQPAGEQRPWPVCRDCGAKVSRREYLRCSACAPKGRPRKKP